MGEQVADGDRGTELGKFGDELADVVVERKLAVKREQVDRTGGELLRGRRHVERRLAGDRDLVLDVGEAVTTGEEELPVLDRGDGAPWRGGGREREERVDAGIRRLGGDGRRADRRSGDQDREKRDGTARGEAHGASGGRGVVRQHGSTGWNAHLQGQHAQLTEAPVA